MRKALICVLVAVFSMAAIAQQPASASATSSAGSQPLPPNAASRDRVLKLFDVLNVKKTAETMMQAMVQQIKVNAAQSFQQETPNATPEQLDKFNRQMDAVMQDAKSSLRLDEMIEVTIPVYQRHFTNADIDTIVAFYSSPTGQKFLTELPQIVQEGMTAMAPVQRQMVEDMTKKIHDRLEKEQQEEKEKANNPSQDLNK